MIAGPNCNCLICRLETSLATELGTAANHENYRQIAASTLILAGFPFPLDLIQHLHRPEIVRKDPSPDQILVELIRQRSNLSLQQFRHSMLLLVFIPTMHRTATQLSSSFPSLARDDIAQHAVTVLLEFIDSKQLQSRQSHLAFTVARHIRRAAFRWAIHESRIAGAEEPDGPLRKPTELETSEDHSHSAVLLREFLDNCERKGWLTSVERRILTQSKIEGVSCQELSRRDGRSSVALQHRIQRLIDRLRRLTRKQLNEIPQQLELFPK